MNESNTQTINMIPDHVCNMRLGVMLAARGVTNEGLEGILKEAEKVGRLADAMCEIIKHVSEAEGTENVEDTLHRAAARSLGMKGIHKGFTRAVEIMTEED